MIFRVPNLLVTIVKYVENNSSIGTCLSIKILQTDVLNPKTTVYSFFHYERYNNK